MTPTYTDMCTHYLTTTHNTVKFKKFIVKQISKGFQRETRPPTKEENQTGFILLSRGVRYQNTMQ